MLKDVPGELVVDLGATLLHGLDGIEDEGQLLVFHLDEPGRLGAGHLVLRHHRGHVVAIVAHVPVEQEPVRHILMGFLHRPGVAGRGEGDVGHVEAGEDADHPGHLHGLGDVHGLHKAMGDGGAHHPDEQGALVTQIVRVLGASGHLVERIHTGHTFSYDHGCPPY